MYEKWTSNNAKYVIVKLVGSKWMCVQENRNENNELNTKQLAD